MGAELSDDVEAIVVEVLRKRYLTRQRRSVAAVYREIARQCRLRGLRVPSRGTVARRIARLDPASSVAAREGDEAARRLQPAGGVPPAVTGLLEQVQVDHTPVDVIVVDEQHRLPIGLAVFDGGDRCGEPVCGGPGGDAGGAERDLGRAVPGARGLRQPAVAGAAGGVEAVWPMSGKPRELYVDNAAEFKSEALRRGCDQHGIRLRYRPPGLPHFGGIIERLIGTMMELVHELPGTTFSSTAERGAYDSEKTAALTVRELQRWLALAVACYHGQVHETLGRTPAGVWAEKAAGAELVTVTGETAFLVDFLPVIRRTLSRSGFVIDYVQYYSDALRPWIARREELGRFVLRRDPRDISRIWALDPEGTEYVGGCPTGRCRGPPISAWEQRAAVARLRELGRAEVDENALFAMVTQMRQITDSAAAATRKARRDRQRRTGTPLRTAPPPKPPAPPAGEGGAEAAPARPFEVIEQW
ncbi:DDE-type integrase/transposase/recombinase [Streptomyces olivoverticillatus]